MRRYALAILGAGNMAEAIVRGLLAGGGVTPDRVVATNRTPARRAYWADAVGVATTADNREAAGHADVVLLGVKPQMCRPVLAEVADVVADDVVIVSIMAGVTAATLDALLGRATAGGSCGRCRTRRSSSGRPAWSRSPRGRGPTAADLATAASLFAPAAAVVEVDESKLSTPSPPSAGPARPTSSSSSNRWSPPASRSGSRRRKAHQLATQTALGAAAR